MSNQTYCEKPLRSLRSTANEVVKQIDKQWKHLLIVRSLTPHLLNSAIGLYKIETAPFYTNKGYEAVIQFRKAINKEFIIEINTAAHSVNQGFIVRLCAYLEYCNTPQKLDHMRNESIM